jgi:hydrogenase maturation protease
MKMKTIVLGLGNTSFGDDGVGVLIARELKNKISDSQVEVAEAAVCGLDVVELVSGFQKAILIDAIVTPGGTPGSIYRLDLSQVDVSRERVSHKIDFLTAFQLAKKLGMELPENLTVLAVEAENIEDSTEKCTDKVSSAIPPCVEMIMRELGLFAVPD